MAGSTIKFFVSNLPEGCTPWELKNSLEDFGELAGTNVAKKRDKTSCHFGFASFKEVKDGQELEKKLRGVRMGDFKLRVNIARFAMENAGFRDQAEPSAQVPKGFGSGDGNYHSNFRDFRSFRDVVGMSKESGSMNDYSVGFADKVEKESVKSVVVPDRTEAFKGLFGVAVVGRVVDLEMLVDFDRLLRIAKVNFAKIQYLGGLSLLVSFPEEFVANQFLESKVIWDPWFSKLEKWNGQYLPLERVAWLRLSITPFIC
ncbi:putative RNA recognition motif domain, nucleotide-binding alpha-beta plait domain superfamily [Helianthus debilis subsp. tardiflorus]